MVRIKSILEIEKQFNNRGWHHATS
jgi:hypothetical protein